MCKLLILFVHNQVLSVKPVKNLERKQNYMIFLKKTLSNLLHCSTYRGSEWNVSSVHLVTLAGLILSFIRNILDAFFFFVIMMVLRSQESLPNALRRSHKWVFFLNCTSSLHYPFVVHIKYITLFAMQVQCKNIQEQKTKNTTTYLLEISFTGHMLHQFSKGCVGSVC